MTPEFKAWPKIPRLNRDITITEKIDGTNAAVIVAEDGTVAAQSRTRIITPGKSTDNFGFAAWVAEHEDELRELGVGHHFGEWYGQGIQRGYGLDERRFALFNLDKQSPVCHHVPLMARTTADRLNQEVADALHDLRAGGSWATKFDRPEGIVVYHHAARVSFKVLLEGDNIPKGVS